MGYQLHLTYPPGLACFSLTRLTSPLFLFRAFIFAKVWNPVILKLFSSALASQKTLLKGYYTLPGFPNPCHFVPEPEAVAGDPPGSCVVSHQARLSHSPSCKCERGTGLSCFPASISSLTFKNINQQRNKKEDTMFKKTAVLPTPLIDGVYWTPSSHEALWTLMACGVRLPSVCSGSPGTHCFVHPRRWLRKPRQGNEEHLGYGREERK